MRSLRLCGWLYVAMALPSVASAQVKPSGKPKPIAGQAVVQPGNVPTGGINLPLAFPPDTDSVAIARPPPDTLPTIDVAARRDSLAGGVFPERDADFMALTGQTGFRIVEYRGQQVRLDIETEAIHLRGDAQANYGSDVLQADSITYLGTPQFMIARGGIELVGENQAPVKSDSLLYYDVSKLRGTIFDARTEFAANGANWFVKGTAVPKGRDTVFVSSGSFTSCEYETPHYYFKAKKIKVVAQDVIVAWPVLLYVDEVPVFWLPFFAQDIRPGRHSGILPPRFGFNDIFKTSSTYDRQVSDFGYYWAISPYLDAQTTIDWFSGNYTRLNGAFRYRVLKQFLQGNARASYSFGNAGRVWDVAWDHDHQLSPATRLVIQAHYVNNTQLFQDQSFNPVTQTQTIDSNVGLTEQWSFATLNLGARRRQFLGVSSQTQLTLPDIGLNFAPLTLFAAPRSRAGAFSNLVWNGGFTLQRMDLKNQLASDVLTTLATTRSSFRLGNLNLNSSAQYNDVVTSPFDTLTGPQPSVGQTTVTWSSGVNYQINLVGSTRFSPGVQVNGARFRSPDTNDSFVSAPTRYAFQATLSTDLYGFYPGIGPFSRIRHKLSPSVAWSYAPAVNLTAQQMAIPGFPVAAGDAVHTLSIGLTQTFEAKVRSRPQAAAEAGADTGRVVGAVDTTAAPVATDTSAAVPTGAEGAGAREPQPQPSDSAGVLPQPISQPQERKIVLLAINTLTPLTFDFERAKKGEPTLITETFSNTLTSDLLRGFTINLTHDLFEGSGATRKFSPFLQSLSVSFSLNSGTSLGDVFGLGAAGPSGFDSNLRQTLDSRQALAGFAQSSQTITHPTAGGPWSLSLAYSLLRVRPGEIGQESKTLVGSLGLQPTPKWRVRWSTQYNFTEKQFGAQLISLDRDLHRWQASFQFSKAPNGNVLFQVYVALKDAPEIKLDYGQQSAPQNVF